MDDKQSLYCFKLDPVTGVVTRYEVSGAEWTLNRHAWSRGRDEYVFYTDIGTSSRYRYSVQQRNLDRFVSNKLYTFNPDRNAALNIINKALGDKLSQAQREVSKYDMIISLFQKGNNIVM